MTTAASISAVAGQYDQQHLHVMVVGATGHLGVAVVEELIARNVPVVAVARTPSNSHPFVWKKHHQDVEIAYVDAQNVSNASSSYASVFSSFPGITTAVSCLAARPNSSRVDEDFWAIDRDANIIWGCEALHAGVKHVILVATFEGRDSRSVSEFSAAKEDAVDVLRRECRAHGAIFTVIRPNAYFKDLTDFAFGNVLAHNLHTVLGSGLHRINPIDREDVARFMVDCIQQRRDGEFPLGGPDIFSFAEIGILAAEAIHGSRDVLRVRHIPLWTLRLLAFVFRPVGYFSRWARRKVAFVNWMVYCSTHDAIGPCYGTHHLRDHYELKWIQMKRQNEVSSADGK